MPDLTWQLKLGPVISKFVYAVSQGLAREIACFSARGEGKTIGALAAMGAHAQEHARQGFQLPVDWMGVTDFHRSHKEKTVISLQKDIWRGAWSLFDEDHLAVFKTDKELVRLHLFGVEDQGAVDRVRRESCGLWVEEPAPATTGPGVSETTWSTAISSLRIPSHARVAMLTTNPPDEDHWTWKRFNPNVGLDFGRHPDKEERMWFRIPVGDNVTLPEGYRQEMFDSLADRPDLQRRLALGLPGQIALGPQVAVGFREDKHVSPSRLKPDEREPLLMGADGGHTPTITIGQNWRGEMRVYASLTIDRGGMRQLVELEVKPWLVNNAPWALRQRNTIGVYDSSMPDDESDSDRNPTDVLDEMIGGFWQPGPISWEARKGILITSLNRKDPQSFDPALKLDSIDCKGLIQALTSRWYYPVTRSGQVSRDKPMKPNHPWEDYGDSFVNFLAAAMPEMQREKVKGEGQKITKFDARFVEDTTETYDVWDSRE